MEKSLQHMHQANFTVRAPVDAFYFLWSPLVYQWQAERGDMNGGTVAVACYAAHTQLPRWKDRRSQALSSSLWRWRRAGQLYLFTKHQASTSVDDRKADEKGMNSTRKMYSMYKTSCPLLFCKLLYEMGEEKMEYLAYRGEV